MEKKVELRKVEQDDTQAIKNMMCLIYEDELKKWFYGKEEALYIPGYDSIEMQRYHMWDDKYFMIMYECTMVGVVLVSTTGREHGRIDRFYVLPEYQGKGIGSEAITLIETIFPEVKVWTLDTTKFSPRNHHFYEKNGYQLDSENETERYYYKTIGEFTYEKDNYHIDQDYSGHNFRNSNLANTDWYNLNIYGSTFSNSNLGNTIFQNANLDHARFTNVNLSNSTFGDFKMKNAELCHGSLSNVHIHDINLDIKKETSLTLERCILADSLIRQCDLKNIKIDSCDLKGATIDGISVTELLECYRKAHL